MDTLMCPHCGKDVNAPPKRRTTGWHSQNHHIRGHAAQIARETGNDMADVMAGIKLRAIKRGFPEPRLVKVKGRKPVEILKSEADCTTVECAMLIEEAHQVSDELGIVLREES
jgi:hypothetical protein